MARKLFSGRLSLGGVARKASWVVYSNAAASTLADVTDLNGSALSGSVVSAVNGDYAFYGPDGVRTLYARPSTDNAVVVTLTATGDTDAAEDADLSLLTASLSSTYGPKPPTGAFAVFATEDEAVADAFPQYTWLILEPLDTTAPTVPTGLTATPGDGQVVLDWSDSTDAVGVTGYRVYRGGVLIASPATSTYTDTGRTNGVLLSYTVAAADAAGNVSAQTSAVTATPTAALVIEDAFTRAGSTTSMGSATTGQAWVPVLGVWGITTNTAYCPTPVNNSSNLAKIGPGLANGRTECTVQSQSATPNDNMGLVFRYQDINNYWNMTIDGVNDVVVFQKVVAGVATTVASVALNPTSFGIYKLTVEHNGSSLTGYVDDVQVLTATDSALATATDVGLCSYHGGSRVTSAVRWDSLTVEAL